MCANFNAERWDIVMGKLDITAEYKQVTDPAGQEVPILILRFSDRNTKKSLFEFGIGKPQLEVWLQEMGALESKWLREKIMGRPGHLILPPSVGNQPLLGNEEALHVDGLEEAAKDP